MRGPEGVPSNERVDNILGKRARRHTRGSVESSFLRKQHNHEFSVLHHDVQSFVKSVELSEEDMVLCEEVRNVIEDTCVSLLGERAQVRPFGSYASGLCTTQSDLDLVVLNVLKVRITGYTIRQRAQAVKSLYTIAKLLVANRDLNIASLKVVPTAKVPVLKITIKEGIEVDLVIFTKSGLSQAAYIRKLLPIYPAARPVCLVVKTLLKKLRLDDPASGGVGGYALANMVIAHCQILRETCKPDIDIGEVLMQFFERYSQMDFSRYAVTVRSGGIIPKYTLERDTKEWIRYSEGWQGRTNGKRLLYVEDPLSGVNLTAGTKLFSVIQWNFQLAHERMSKMREAGQEHYALDELFEIGSRGSQKVRAHCCPIQHLPKRTNHLRFKVTRHHRNLSIPCKPLCWL